MTLSLVPDLTDADKAFLRRNGRGIRDYYDQADDTFAPPAATDRQAAPDSARYQPGDVLEYSWGWEQTNIDFFLVTKRTTSPKGTVMLTLVELDQVRTYDGSMVGHCTPAGVKAGAKPFRRKLYIDTRDGGHRESGCAIRSYGWASSWDGKPAAWTGYA